MTYEPRATPLPDGGPGYRMHYPPGTYREPVIVKCVRAGCSSAKSYPPDVEPAALASDLGGYGWVRYADGSWMCPVWHSGSFTPLHVAGPRPLTMADRAAMLDEALARSARHGWRVDATSGTTATVSRPWLWLPTWAHLTLTVVTCCVWAPVWAYARSPKCRRTTRHASVDHAGRLLGIRVPHT